MESIKFYLEITSKESLNDYETITDLYSFETPLIRQDMMYQILETYKYKKLFIISLKTWHK